MVPWSIKNPCHLQKVTDFIWDQPWCLVDSLVLDHQNLYRKWRDCCAAQISVTLPHMPAIDWAALQHDWLDGASKVLAHCDLLLKSCVRVAVRKWRSSNKT